MKRRVLAWAWLACMASYAVSAEAAGIKVLQDRFIIGFRRDVPAAERRRIVERMGGRVFAEFDPIQALAAEPSNRPAAAFRADLGRHPAVLHVANDFYAKWIDSEPRLLDPGLSDFQAVHSRILGERQAFHKTQGEAPPSEVQWGVQRVNAPAAWPAVQGSGVKVAIVDTGIDPAHPELAANIAGGVNALEKDKPWADDHFHGTHVAGIVAAALDGKGVVGVAPQAKLYAVKVLNKEGGGTLVSILQGMMWCIENGMQIANMSLGTEQGNFFFEYAVQMMVQKGVTLVAAAGNSEGAVNFPAAYKEAIAVSALDQEDKIAKFSSRGPEVDFIAPGVKIPSTITGGGIQAYSGTSMATPHVSGLAALAVAKGAQGPEAVRAALAAASSLLPGLSANEQGSGLVNASRLAR